MNYREVKCHPHAPQIVKGALVTAYNRGYHRINRVIKEITDGDPFLLVEYYQVVTSKGTIPRGHRLYVCHVDYCKLVDPKAIRDKKIDEANTLYTNLLKAMNDS